MHNLKLFVYTEINFNNTFLVLTKDNWKKLFKRIF